MTRNGNLQLMENCKLPSLYDCIGLSCLKLHGLAGGGSNVIEASRGEYGGRYLLGVLYYRCGNVIYLHQWVGVGALCIDQCTADKGQTRVAALVGRQAQAQVAAEGGAYLQGCYLTILL